MQCTVINKLTNHFQPVVWEELQMIVEFILYATNGALDKATSSKNPTSEQRMRGSQQPSATG